MAFAVARISSGRKSQHQLTPAVKNPDWLRKEVAL